MPIFLRDFLNALDDNLVKFTSFRMAEPFVGSTNLLIHLIKVDFPAPDGPMSASTCPLGILKSIPCKARSPVLYLFVKFSNFNINYSFLKSQAHQKAWLNLIEIEMLLTVVANSICFINLSNYSPVIHMANTYKTICFCKFFFIKWVVIKIPCKKSCFDFCN